MRKPEQGTRPKVFYVGADARRAGAPLQDAPAANLWGQRAGEPVSLTALAGGWQPAAAAGGDAEARRRARPHGLRRAARPRPWGWKVSAYLWTKSIAAGALLVAASAGVLGVAGSRRRLRRCRSSRSSSWR